VLNRPPSTIRHEKPCQPPLQQLPDVARAIAKEKKPYACRRTWVRFSQSGPKWKRCDRIALRIVYIGMGLQMAPRVKTGKLKPSRMQAVTPSAHPEALVGALWRRHG